MLNAIVGRFRSVPELSNVIDTSTWGSWGAEPGAVDRDSALQLMAVYGSVRLITDGISTLPVDVFDGQGGEAAPPEWLLHPVDDLTYESWCSQLLTSLLLDGNAYVSIGRDGFGRVTGAVPLDPAVVDVTRGPTGKGRKRFVVNGTEASNEILHLSGMMLPGAIKGLSPVEHAMKTIGLGLNAVDFGREFFGGDGNMPGVIELSGPQLPDVMLKIAKQWQRKRRKGGKGLPGVLENGATWKPTGVNHEQAQFLATRNFTAAEIAGQMFLVDPSDLGISVAGTSLTYSNLQQRNTRRLQVTFLPWIVKLEVAMSALTDRPGEFVKLNVDALLRGDQSSRYTAYGVGLDKEFLTIDEVRALEDLPPLPDGGAAAGGAARELAEMIQKIYLGVGVVLTAEEARVILNRAGADFPPGVDPTQRTS